MYAPHCYHSFAFPHFSAHVICQIFTLSASSRIFSCFEQPNFPGLFSLSDQSSIECYGSFWRSVLLPLALFGLTLYGVVFPLLLLRILLRPQSERCTLEFQARYGFLLSPYTDRFWWWEIVVVVRKALISVTLGALASQPEVQRSTAITIFGGLAVLQASFQPYACNYNYSAVHNNSRIRFRHWACTDTVDRK
jgi:hypothetical protein